MPEPAVEYSIRSKVWLYPGMAGWHFVTVPQKQSADIHARFSLIQRGWASLPVVVTIRETSWNTSIFFDKQRDAYLLPLKADVRKQERIEIDDVIALTVRIRTDRPDR